MYGNPFYEHAGYGNVFSIDDKGKLDKNIQNYEYSEKSAIHGMVFDPAETYLYSADMWADKIWTHKKDADGKLTLVGRVDAPQSGDHPRWVELHPSGHYLYALMEAGNRLGVYVIDEHTHLPVFTHTSYPLVPPGRYNASKAGSMLTLPRRPRPQEDVSCRRGLLLFEWQISVRNRQV